jgi:hypothetical protein
VSWTGDDGIAHLGWLAEFVMRTSPPLAPHAPGQDTYLVLDDFGRLGRAWRETFENATDRETLIRNLVEGEFNIPIRIVAFNSAEGWCRDATVDIADELRRRYTEFGEVPESVLQFMEANRRSDRGAAPCTEIRTAPADHLKSPCPFRQRLWSAAPKVRPTSAQVQELPMPNGPLPAGFLSRADAPAARQRAFGTRLPPGRLRPEKEPEGITLDVPSTIPRA